MSIFLVLGGAGDMGSAAVRDLVLSGVDGIIIGDFNKGATDKLKGELKDRGTDIKGIYVDANDRKSLTDAISQCDVVINTIGPFYRYEKMVVDAALEVGRDYVDICDDFDATLKVVERDKDIAKGKSRILIGMGWTPGITNVLARAGYDSLDATTDVNIGWSGSAADASGIAVVSHVFHAVTGDVPMYLDGKLEYVPARQFKRDIDFPEPISRLETYFVGHPEPITIPRYLKGVKNVTLRGALVPDWQNHLVSQFADIGLTEDKIVKVGNIEVSSRDFLASFVHQSMEQFKSGGVEVSGFWVEVIGKQNGKKTTIVYSGADRMQKLTGWSASIGAQEISKNRDLKPGLYAPEGAIDPDTFIRELKKRNVTIGKTITTEGD
ncbi:MAG: saccharopine dehydrogenase NADP-binding domain-containing protein [Thermoplasmatales archaeon]|nr:saccharopine dehydrogenase NADP-binding domain-containing protein [Candidatus Thermoplasmatota archaeon]MDA8055337.1 saccharopine dehydrogenase NADP-binding domain-containing protein [Thermoplasmatales archaeon]